VLLLGGQAMGIFRRRFIVTLLFAFLAALPANLAQAQTNYDFGGLNFQINGNISNYTSTWAPSWSRGLTFEPTNVSVGGMPGTIGIGYNAPVYRSPYATWLAGFKADYGLGPTSGRDDCFGDLADCLTSIENNFTFRGVLGINPAGSPIEFYVTGGAATAGVFDQKFLAPGVMPMHVSPAILEGVSRQVWGYTVGGGIQYQVLAPGALSPAVPGAVSLNLEWLYENLGKFDPTRGIADTVSGTQVRAGVTYNTLFTPVRLNWGSGAGF
jgi:opacity protein-like surface antigen